MAQHLNISRGTMFFVLLTAGILLQIADHDSTKALGYRFQQIAGPVLRIGRAIQPTTTLAQKDDPGKLISPSEYRKLQTRYDNLNAELLDLQQRYSKLAHIRTILPEPGPALVVADVIQTAISPTQRELILNISGQSQSVKPGQYVLGDDTIIGTISDVYSSRARVRLVTDSRHFLPAGILLEGARDYIPAQIGGAGDGTCKIPLLSRKDHDIQVGSAVFAMKRTGFLDTPILIGKVSSVQPDEKQPLLWDITVQPAGQVETLGSVAIVVMDLSDGSKPGRPEGKTP
ncbi:MAG: rod shape-determining protein MreC [Phycisphaerae bacterium]|nr:rod shape-determining protein MreC [Phycisphaerae bacterium]